MLLLRCFLVMMVCSARLCLVASSIFNANMVTFLAYLNDKGQAIGQADSVAEMWHCEIKVP